MSYARAWKTRRAGSSATARTSTATDEGGVWDERTQFVPTLRCEPLEREGTHMAKAVILALGLALSCAACVSSEAERPAPPRPLQPKASHQGSKAVRPQGL